MRCERCSGFIMPDFSGDPSCINCGRPAQTVPVETVRRYYAETTKPRRINQFAKRARARTVHGLAQYAVAKELGLGEQNRRRLGDWERGETNELPCGLTEQDYHAAIARLLDCSVAEVLAKVRGGITVQ